MAPTRSGEMERSFDNLGDEAATPNTVLMRHTYRRDAKLEGVMDGDDYMLWLNAYLLDGPPLGGRDGPASLVQQWGQLPRLAPIARLSGRRSREREKSRL
jgi:hypothetical protein